jgi:hypothetical protein
MLPTLLRNPGISLTVSQQGIHTREYNSPGLASSLRPRRDGFKALTGLSLLRVPN